MTKIVEFGKDAIEKLVKGIDVVSETAFEFTRQDICT